MTRFRRQTALCPQGRADMVRQANRGKPRAGSQHNGHGSMNFARSADGARQKKIEIMTDKEYQAFEASERGQLMAAIAKLKNEYDSMYAVVNNADCYILDSSMEFWLALGILLATPDKTDGERLQMVNKMIADYGKKRKEVVNGEHLQRTIDVCNTIDLISRWSTNAVWVILQHLGIRTLGDIIERRYELDYIAREMPDMRQFLDAMFERISELED